MQHHGPRQTQRSPPPRQPSPAPRVLTRSRHALPRASSSAPQVPRRMIGTDAFQETPIVEVTRAITKHNYLVMDIKDLPR